MKTKNIDKAKEQHKLISRMHRTANRHVAKALASNPTRVDKDGEIVPSRLVSLAKWARNMTTFRILKMECEPALERLRQANAKMEAIERHASTVWR